MERKRRRRRRKEEERIKLEGRRGGGGGGRKRKRKDGGERRGVRLKAAGGDAVYIVRRTGLGSRVYGAIITGGFARRATSTCTSSTMFSLNFNWHIISFLTLPRHPHCGQSRIQP